MIDRQLFLHRTKRALLMSWNFLGPRVCVICLILLELLATIVSAEDQASSTHVLAPQAEVTPGGGLNFYTTYKGQRTRRFAITPAGSLIAGGVSSIHTPKTNEPPTIDPAEYDARGDDQRAWIHDFYFGRYEPGDGQPRLHTRGLIMWGRGDSPDVQMGRTGPDNAPTTYGPPEDTEPGSCLGKMIFTAWGQGEFQGDIAGIYARNDDVPTSERNPGSLHLGTAGPSVGTAAQQTRAWRDMIDRLVITSRGYIAIGDGFTDAAERLHVDGNILANGNVTAAGEIVAHGAMKMILSSPASDGKKIVHAAIAGPDAAVIYRGEGQLAGGRTVVKLPDYFEQLTAKEGRTVLLTNVDGFDRLAVERQSGLQVANGQFVVISENAASSQAFSWEVQAKRADIASLDAAK